MDELIPVIKALTEAIDKLTIAINSYNTAISNQQPIDASFNYTNVVSNSITESIVLYSLSNDPLFNNSRLNIGDYNYIIRLCRCNDNNIKALINRHKGCIITIHRIYRVSNPHNIGDYMINELKKYPSLNIDFKYKHLLINADDKDRVLKYCNDIIHSFKDRLVVLESMGYILNPLKDTDSDNKEDIKKETN